MKNIFNLFSILLLSISTNAQIGNNNSLEINPQFRGLLENYSPTNIKSVGYPLVTINGKDLEKSLFFISASRLKIADFPTEWHISSILDYDQNPSSAKQTIDIHLENMKTMRAQLYEAKAYVKNGEDVMDAIKTLKAKSALILTHIDRYAPWPSLSEVQNPPKTIKDVMTECCNYYYWYNSFLFLVGHIYDVEDPSSSQHQTEVKFTDEKIYREKFKNGYVLVNNFDDTREKLLFSREIVKADINSLISLLESYQSKMQNYAIQIPVVIKRNQDLYDGSSAILEKYIETERAEAEVWIRNTNLTTSLLRDSVNYYDSMITVHSQKYYGVQHKIRDNELVLGKLQKNVTQLTNSSFELVKNLDSLRIIANRLLTSCKDQDATDNCVKFPDSLKMVNKQIKLYFEKFTNLMDYKNSLSDSALHIARLNDSLSLVSEKSFNKFIEIRDKYSPIASAYIQNQSNIKEGMNYNREKYHLMGVYYDKLQIILGKKPDPLIVRIRESLRLDTIIPRIGPLTSPDITDPSRPWNPGWVDPVRIELLKELNIQEIKIDLNKENILRGN